MPNTFPEKLMNFTAYRNGDERLGTVDAELPSLELMTDTVKGAGISGELDMPVRGHYASMSLKLNWRTLDVPMLRLSGQKVHAIDLRGNQQVFDPSEGYIDQGVKVSIRGVPKTTELGKFEVGATTGSANELEVTYIKVEIDGKRILEIDKFNFIAFIDGEDVFETARKNLGM